MHKYESRSVGLDMKLFQPDVVQDSRCPSVPRCGPGHRFCAYGWRWGSSRRQLSAPPDKGRVKPGAAPQRGSSPPSQEAFVFFPPSAERQNAEPGSSAPHLNQPSPYLSVILHQEPQPPPFQLSPATGNRLLHPCSCSLSVRRSEWLHSTLMMIPGRSQERRKREGFTIHAPQV